MLIYIQQPQHKRMVDDTERRLNALFDSLNCETLSPPVLEQLNSLTEGQSPLFLSYNVLKISAISDVCP